MSQISLSLENPEYQMSINGINGKPSHLIPDKFVEYIFELNKPENKPNKSESAQIKFKAKQETPNLFYKIIYFIFKNIFHLQVSFSKTEAQIAFETQNDLEKKVQLAKQEQTQKQDKQRIFIQASLQAQQDYQGAIADLKKKVDAFGAAKKQLLEQEKSFDTAQYDVLYASSSVANAEAELEKLELCKINLPSEIKELQKEKEAAYAKSIQPMILKLEKMQQEHQQTLDQLEKEDEAFRELETARIEKATNRFQAKEKLKNEKNALVWFGKAVLNKGYDTLVKAKDKLTSETETYEKANKELMERKNKREELLQLFKEEKKVYASEIEKLEQQLNSQFDGEILRKQNILSQIDERISDKKADIKQKLATKEKANTNVANLKKEVEQARTEVTNSESTIQSGIATLAQALIKHAAFQGHTGSEDIEKVDVDAYKNKHKESLQQELNSELANINNTLAYTIS